MSGLDNGNIIAQLEQARSIIDTVISSLSAGTRVDKKKKVISSPAANSKLSQSEIDLEMPLRAFAKKYSSGLSGGQKFALLLAHMTKGNEQKIVPLSKIEKSWNTITAKGLFGMKFNRFYTSNARENDWVVGDGGGYRLRPNWRKIFDD